MADFLANGRELASALERDYKNVHHNVPMLEAAGLPPREGRKLSVLWYYAARLVYINMR